MFKSNQSANFFILLLSALAIGTISGQEETRTVERDSLSATIPNPFGETPLFETNNQNGRYFGVHIPLLYDFSFHWREGGGLTNMKISQTILSGVHSYTYDRAPNAQGQMEGPIKFSILGIPILDNGQQPPQPQPQTPPPAPAPEQPPQ